MYRTAQPQPQFVKAVAGDKVHQAVAIYYYKNGITPAEAIDTLKASNYLVQLSGTTYKLQGSSVASILTGILIASPAKTKKLSPIDNGTTKEIPNIPA